MSLAEGSLNVNRKYWSFIFSQGTKINNKIIKTDIKRSKTQKNIVVISKGQIGEIKF